MRFKHKTPSGFLFINQFNIVINKIFASLHEAYILVGEKFEMSKSRRDIGLSSCIFYLAIN